MNKLYINCTLEDRYDNIFSVNESVPTSLRISDDKFMHMNTLVNYIDYKLKHNHAEVIVLFGNVFMREDYQNLIKVITSKYPKKTLYISAPLADVEANVEFLESLNNGNLRVIAEVYTTDVGLLHHFYRENTPTEVSIRKLACSTLAYSLALKINKVSDIIQDIRALNLGKVQHLIISPPIITSELKDTEIENTLYNREELYDIIPRLVQEIPSFKGTVSLLGIPKCWLVNVVGSSMIPNNVNFHSLLIPTENSSIIYPNRVVEFMEHITERIGFVEWCGNCCNNLCFGLFPYLIDEEYKHNIL